MFGSLEKVSALYNESCAKIWVKVTTNPSLVLFGLGVLILLGGMNELAEAQGNAGTPREACGRLLSYIEGGFGALLAAAAGIGAIVAAALGGFKAAWALVVVSVGAFILRAYITLFQGTCTSGFVGVNG